MKDQIQSLRTLSESLESDEVKMQLDSIATALQNLYLMLDGKLKLTTKLSISRKEKLNDLYLKVNEIPTYQSQIAVLTQLNEKLAKYRLVAVALKKLFSDRIKTLFLTKLANETSKDYSKYKAMYPNFNFESDELTAYDNNKKTYLLLQSAGVFGTDTLTTTKPLPKSNPNDKPKTSRWNK